MQRQTAGGSEIQTFPDHRGVLTCWPLFRACCVCYDRNHVAIEEEEQDVSL